MNGIDKHSTVCTMIFNRQMLKVNESLKAGKINYMKHGYCLMKYVPG